MCKALFFIHSFMLNVQEHFRDYYGCRAWCVFAGFLVKIISLADEQRPQEKTCGMLLEELDATGLELVATTHPGPGWTLLQAAQRINKSTLPE